MPRLKKLDGILLFDKPHGLTSHAAVAKVRRTVDQREVGHTGTLDPLATGLLVLCLGRATKVTQFLSECDKSYTATVRLGMRSSTYDAEGIDDSSVPEKAPLELDDSLVKLLNGFVGPQDQLVPPHASVRLNGRHMYELTRKGESFERPIRQIVINSLEIVSYKRPDLVLQVSCTKGTYIRTLANDIGEQLGCGGYLSDLRRTRVGQFSVNDALTLEQMEFLQQSDRIESCLVPIAKALDLSSMSLANGGSEFVAHGRSPRWEDVLRIQGAFRTGDRILLTDSLGSALAVAIAGTDSMSEHSPSSSPVDGYVRVLA